MVAVPEIPILGACALCRESVNQDFETLCFGQSIFLVSAKGAAPVHVRCYAGRLAADAADNFMLQGSRREDGG